MIFKRTMARRRKKQVVRTLLQDARDDMWEVSWALGDKNLAAARRRSNDAYSKLNKALKEL